MNLSEVKYKKCEGCGRMHPQAKWLGFECGYNSHKLCKGYEFEDRKLCKPCERDAK